MLQQLINTVTLGTVYAIVALGFTLYFGTVGLINFAHGDFCTIAAFVVIGTTAFCEQHGLVPSGGLFVVAVTLAILVTSCVSMTSERFVFRSLRSRPPLEGLIVSIGLSMMIREGILHFYPDGGNPHYFPSMLLDDSLVFWGISISYAQLALLTTALVLTLIFFAILRWTEFGRRLRAVTQDAEAARMIGIRVDRVIFTAFAVGGVLAAAAGTLHGAVYGSIRFDTGVFLGVKGFAAAVFGGLRSPWGALAGGMALATMETIIITTIPGGSAYRDAIAFAVLLMIIALRPQGILGGHGRA